MKKTDRSLNKRQMRASLNQTGVGQHKIDQFLRTLPSNAKIVNPERLSAAFTDFVMDNIAPSKKDYIVPKKEKDVIIPVSLKTLNRIIDGVKELEEKCQHQQEIINILRENLTQILKGGS